MIKELQEQILILTDRVHNQQETIDRLTLINKHNFDLILHFLSITKDRK